MTRFGPGIETLSCASVRFGPGLRLTAAGSRLSIGPLIACHGQACFHVRAGVMVLFEVMASC